MFISPKWKKTILEMVELVSTLGNGLKIKKIVTKSRSVNKYCVTKSRLHWTTYVIRIGQNFTWMRHQIMNRSASCCFYLFTAVWISQLAIANIFTHCNIERPKNSYQTTSFLVDCPRQVQSQKWTGSVLLDI